MEHQGADVAPSPGWAHKRPAVWRAIGFWSAFLALLLFHIAANIWWLNTDNHVIRTDEEVHMEAARHYYEAFTDPQHNSFLKRLVALASIKPGNPVHPPLL